MFGFRRRRRQRLMSRPFPPEWTSILERNVPLYRRLSPADQQELRGRILVFLDEKRFEGCGGLTMSDDIRVTIAAHACVLLLHREETGYYPLLKSIVVYPSHFVVQQTRPGPGGLALEGWEARAGESWRHGAVVLAWDHVQRQAADLHDGHNVVLHEFAHQLDQEDGRADGVPLLPRRTMYTAWARILGQDYRELVSAAEGNGSALLDTYGATNPAEFFAVATEFFFEAPRQLQARHPKLYEELQLYYRQDPAALPPEPRGSAGGPTAF